MENRISAAGVVDLRIHGKNPVLVPPLPGIDAPPITSQFTSEGVSTQIQTSGTAVFGGGTKSLDVFVPGLTPSGLIRVWQQDSSGGFTSFTVVSGSGKFTISTPSSPELVDGDGLVFNFGWSLVTLR